MQQTMLVVRVGNDVRFFNNGKVPFASVSVCENQYYKDKETGEKKNFATWITVIGYGPKAEFMRDYLKKRMRLVISGVWKNTVYEKDGIKHYQLVLRLKDVEFLDSKATLDQGEEQGSEQIEARNDDFVHVEMANQPFGTDFNMPSYIPGIDDEE